MNLFRMIWLIARRDYRERVRGRAFLLATAILVILSVGGVIAADVGKDIFGGTETHTIGLVNAPGGLQPALDASGDAFDMRIKTRQFTNEAAANAALNAGDVDAVLIGAGQLRFKDNEDKDLASAVAQAARITQLADQLRDAGVSNDTITRMLSPQPLQVTYTDKGGSSDDNAGAAYIMAIVLFGALMTYNQWILMGVIEEKSTRIVEVLLAVVRPWQLLMGKLAGVLSVAVTQMVIVAVAFLITLAAIGGVSIPQVSAGGLIVAIVWFVLGLLFYSVAFAAVGATVSRQEDASTASAPLTMILMAAYFISLFLVTGDAGSMAAQVLTFFPPAAPLIVPVRFSLGAMGPLALAISIALMVLATVAISWLGGRLYTGAVLRTGPRLGLRDAWRTIQRSGAGQ